MIITITGLPGSGKTTVVKQLSQILGVPWYSVGNLRGKMAEERGMTIDEFNALGETEAFTDKEVDDYQAKLGASAESFVIDGRLSWHFIPNSFKVFLDVDPDIGAQRIYSASQKGERDDEKAYTSVDEVKHHIHERVASDVRRYKKYYGIDFLDKSNYDLVLDTTNLTIEEKARIILSKMPQS
ncbi:MAG: cytidylate kinase family protein [Candidatus Uhrbacteria bacterium]|nr:cytidylate kinase family protein [Candidatus Uhrbacteria bacterium]